MTDFDDKSEGFAQNTPDSVTIVNAVSENQKPYFSTKIKLIISIAFMALMWLLLRPNDLFILPRVGHWNKDHTLFISYGVSVLEFVLLTSPAWVYWLSLIYKKLNRTFPFMKGYVVYVLMWAAYVAITFYMIQNPSSFMYRNGDNVFGKILEIFLTLGFCTFIYCVFTIPFILITYFVLFKVGVYFGRPQPLFWIFVESFIAVSLFIWLLWYLFPFTI